MSYTLEYVEQLKQDVIDSCQILDKEHLWEVFSEGHTSARIPGTDKFIIMGHMHPRGSGMGGVKSVQDLVVMDTNMNKISGAYEPMNEAIIHAYIYRNRPDVGGVVYAHPHHCGLFATIMKPIPSFGDTIPVWDSKGAIADPERAEGFVKAIGNRNAILLKNTDSLITASSTVRDATVMVYNIEIAAKKDHDAIVFGKLYDGPGFVYQPSYYMPQISKDPRYPMKGNLTRVDEIGADVIHTDMWKFLRERNLNK